MNTQYTQYTIDHVRSFVENSADYTSGADTLGGVLLSIGADVSCTDGLGKRIDEMHTLSDEYDTL